MSVCTCMCLEKIPETVLKNITNDYFNSCRTKGQKCQYILDRLSMLEGALPGQYTLMIGYTKVCGKAFCSAYSLSSSTFYHYKKLHKNGVRSFVHALSGTEKPDSAKTIVQPFIDGFIAENANFMPDDANKVYLPPGMTMGMLYAEYSKFRVDHPVSLKYFRQLYHKYFKSVSINVKGRFTCSTCTRLRDMLLSCRIGSNVQRDLYTNCFQAHLKRQRLQRQQYQKRIQDSIQYPKSYLCLTTDGMDQNKTLIPYTRHPGMKSSFLIKIHVFGAWFFGRSLTFFLDLQDFPHDSNYHCTAILLKLLSVEGPLPRHLHIQLDNTCGQNKNQNVLTFLAWLVESNIVECVTVGFLMKGHTHQIIDQVFSWVSRAIHFEFGGVLSLSQLYEVLGKCYTAEATPGMSVDTAAKLKVSPQVVRIRRVYAFKQWLKCHARGLHDLHDSHQFLITMEDGHAVLRFKQWAESPEWLDGGEDNDEPTYPLESLPEGYPDLVVPNHYETVNDEKILRTSLLEKTVATGEQCGAFKDTTLEQWKAFFEEENESRLMWESLEQFDDPEEKVQKSRRPKLCKDTDEIPLVEKLVQRVQEQLESVEASEFGEMHPAIQEVQNFESGASYIQPRASGCKRSKVQNLVGPVRKEEILLLKPDMAYCIQYNLDPGVKPWIAKAVEDENDRGFFQVEWFEGQNLHSRFVPQRKFEVQHHNSVVYAGIKLLKGKAHRGYQINKVWRDKIQKQMEPFHAEFLEAVDSRRQQSTSDRIVDALAAGDNCEEVVEEEQSENVGDSMVFVDIYI